MKAATVTEGDKKSGVSQTHVLHRGGARALPVAIGGDGCYLIDSNGKRYLDASGGAAVSCLGHGHPRVIEAMHKQIERLAYAHTSFFTTEPMEALADLLIENAPPGIEKVYFVSGGSEAIEAALKLARQYFVEVGQPQSAVVLLPGGKAITAIRLGRWRLAAMPGEGRLSRRY